MNLNKPNTLTAVICKIEYAFANNIDFIYDSPIPFFKIVIFKDDISWNEIKFSPGTGQFFERIERTDAGILYRQELSFKLPGDDPDQTETLDNMLHTGLIFRIEDTSGTVRIIGDLENPVRITHDKTHNADVLKTDFHINHKSNHTAYLL